MNEDTLRRRVTSMAAAVGGTEAAAFMFPSGSELRLLMHIRPDRATEQQRRLAIAAFQEIVFRCVSAGRDDVFQVSADADPAGPQFCLVSLIRVPEGIMGAVTIITRCPTPQSAHEKLRKVRAIADGQDKPPHARRL